MIVQTSNQIDAVAADWAARVDAAPLSAEEDAVLEAWLDEDPRHLGAFAKACAISVHSERARALGTEFDAALFEEAEGIPAAAETAKLSGEPANQISPFNRPQVHGRTVGLEKFADTPLSRRRALWMGGIAAGVAAAAVSGGVWQLFGALTYTTRLGETRVVPLDDGSVITLNTNSEVTVSYTEARRDIKLLRGEALFDVAKNKKRPFVVEAAGMTVRAVGTSFTVQMLPDQPVRVLVREGIVEVKRPDVPTAPPVRVSTDTRAVAPIDAPIVATRVATADVTRELQWRVGRLAFEGETLRQAAETFSRYSDIRIVIDDPSLANEPITGLFVSNDPVGFSRAVAMSLNAHAEVSAGEVRLTR